MVLPLSQQIIQLPASPCQEETLSTGKIVPVVEASLARYTASAATNKFVISPG